MILADITAGVATLVRPVIGQVYEVPPAGTPEVPCVIVGFPTVTAYHSDMAHSIAKLGCELKVLLGRGDAEGAYRQFQTLLSTEGDGSLIVALETKLPNPKPWHRIAVRTSDEPRDEGDNISVRLTLDLDA